MRQLRYGFVGAGEITAAIVEGLSAEDTPPKVFLSPRGRAVSGDLAARLANVEVCETNRQVLENATAVVLAVRPQVAREVVAELAFRSEHVVISAMAGVSSAQLRDWVAPAQSIVRVIPLPQAAHRQSLTVMYPENAVARELFDRVGGVLVPNAEDTLEAFSAATATFAAHLDYLSTIADWLAEHGVDAESATAYTAHIFGQLGQSLTRHSGPLAALTAKHMTPGGLNEQFMTELRRHDVPGVVRRGLDQVLARVRPAQP